MKFRENRHACDCPDCVERYEACMAYDRRQITIEQLDAKLAEPRGCLDLGTYTKGADGMYRCRGPLYPVAADVVAA